jgi:hypothetical protein
MSIDRDSPVKLGKTETIKLFLMVLHSMEDMLRIYWRCVTIRLDSFLAGNWFTHGY